MEKEFLRCEAPKVRVLDKTTSLRAEVILREMRKGIIPELERDSTILHPLLPYTNRHLQNVDEGTLGPWNHHLLHAVILLQVFLCVLTGGITGRIKLVLLSKDSRIVTPGAALSRS